MQGSHFLKELCTVTFSLQTDKNYFSFLFSFSKWSFLFICRFLHMSCPSWQWHRIGSRWPSVRTLPVAPLWCDLGFFTNIVVIKLRRTSALPSSSLLCLKCASNCPGLADLLPRYRQILSSSPFSPPSYASSLSLFLRFPAFLIDLDCAS